MNPNLMPFGLLSILFKRKWTALGVFLAVFLAGVLYLVIAQPKYESDAQLIVRFGDRSIPTIDRTPVTELTPSDRREIVLSHAAILSSHDLAQATIEALGIGRLYPDIVRRPGRWPAMDEAVKRFLNSLTVEVGTQDNIISVSFVHPDAKLAHDIVAKLVELYIVRQTLIYQNPQSAFMDKEVADAQQRLMKAQTALEQFKSQWRITDYDQEVQDLLQQRGDVDTNLRNAEASLGLAQQKQKEISQLIRKVPTTQPTSASGEKYRSVDEAEARLADLKNKQSQMLATYAPNSPALASLNAAIKQAEAETEARRAEVNGRSANNANIVYQTLQTDLLRTSADAESNSAPVKVLATQLEGIDKRLNDLQQNRGNYNNLVRELQIAEETYRSLSTQYEDARVKDSLNHQRISPATLISQPTAPYRPVRPRKMVTLVACMCVGAMLGVGAALARESRDDRFSSAEQVAFMLDLPILASLESRQPPIIRGLLTYGGRT